MSIAEIKAFRIMQMYRIISNELIAYLKQSGMDNPHPAKEFILELIKVATETSYPFNSINYYWCTDLNNDTMACCSTDELDADGFYTTTGNYDNYYFNILE